MFFRIIIVLFVWIQCAHIATAAELSPQLAWELKSCVSKSFVSAIVILPGPIDIRKLDDELHESQADKGSRHREIIGALRRNAAITQPAFIAELEHEKTQGNVAGYTAYWIENALVVYATAEYMLSLSTRGDILYMSENFRAESVEHVDESHEDHRRALDSETLTPGQQATQATRVNRELGITGQGSIIAIVDAGVDLDHPALGPKWRGNIAPHEECWLDVTTGNSIEPFDFGGHGSHVCGITCGRAFSGIDTITVGAAPNAMWIASNSIDQAIGSELDNDILATFQWLADPDGDPFTLSDVPDVVCNSWGVNAGLGYASCFDYWNGAILNCEAAGPVVIFAAGNEATSGLRSPANYSLNSTQIFAVGSVNATSFSAPYPLSATSSQGPSRCAPNPAAIKPNVVAPGVDVWSCNQVNTYSFRSGTSMAAPHVAGIVALMREACPDCDPTTIKQIIMNSAIDAGYGSPGADNQFGSGFVDAYAAVSTALGYGRVQGIIQNPQGAGLPGSLVRNLAGVQFTSSDQAGHYSIALPVGVFDLEFTAFGYQTFLSPSLTVIAGQATTYDVTLQPLPTYTLGGTVYCYDLPAAGAVVRVINQLLTPDTTDENGYYEFSLPSGNYQLRGQASGCDTLTTGTIALTQNLVVDLTLSYDIRFLCEPPDSQGYGACENGDFNGPTYSWLEISPLQGGPGTLTGLTGDDQAQGFALPFTFRFYGQDYDSVFVNTNGVVSFDSTTTLHNNRLLPVDDLGHAICVYWDDFYPAGGGGDISYYHYAAQSAFIIEWYNLEHYPGAPPRETFQIWLYDVVTNPGPTGDSQFRLQYANVNPASTTTVGLQDGVHGHNHVHLGELSPYAQGIQSGRVLTYGGFEPIGGILEGVITDCFGAPAESAFVSLPGSNFGGMFTDAFGFYSLGVSQSVYDVMAAKSPCSYVLQAGIPVIAGQTVVINLTLNPRPTIEGFVTNCSGGPAAFATVTLLDANYPAALTDSTGYYRHDVAAGVYTVQADNAFCSRVQSDSVIAAENSQTVLNFTLAPPPRIQGQLLDCRGGAAIGSAIFVTGTIFDTLSTDSSGQYALDVPSGSYRIRADNSYCSWIESAEFTISDGEIVQQNFTLRPPPAISGVVLDCQGGTASGALISFPGSAITPLITDSSGHFFVELSSGIYTLRADNQACSFQEIADVTAMDNDTLEMIFQLRAPPAIEGVVTDCRGGAAAATITIFGPETAAVFTNAAGYFFFPTVADTFDLMLDNSWCSRVAITDVLTQENETTRVNITLRNPAQIYGQITDCFGAPASILTVDLFGDSSATVTTNAFGEYFSELYPDTYLVSADNAFCSRAISAPLILADGDSLEQDLQLAAPASISGTIYRCTGGIAAGIIITFPGTELSPLTTDSLGHYHVDVLPGNYVVCAEDVYCSTVQSALITIADGQHAIVDLTLLPGATVSGVITSCLGGAANGAMITLLGSPFSSQSSGVAGNYIFPPIAAGSYSITVSYPGCLDTTISPLILSPGQSAIINVTLNSDPAYSCGTDNGHGYTICENIDDGGPTFNWVPIAPLGGGSGTPVSGLTNNGFVAISIPFPVKLFGTMYTQGFISSNGALTFGSGLSTGDNICLPSAARPAGIYAFWDDLDVTDIGSQVATRYDAVGHIFWLEYYRVPQCCDGFNPVTFEIGIFDETFYPTATDDNEILLQYSGTTFVAGSATIGLQSESASSFYLHSCDGAQNQNAGTVNPGRAISVSTGRVELTVDLAVSPAHITKIVSVGGNSSEILQLCNAGTFYPLDWSMNFYQDTPPILLNTGDDHRDDRALDARGGPDPNGYSWVDSNDPDGPIYHWAEIRTIGTNTNLHANNSFIQVPLPWPFSFYDSTFSAIYISTNGNLQFRSPSNQASNRAIPDPADPDLMMCPLWDDLNTAVFGQIYYYADTLNNRFIVQWDSVGRGVGPGAYTFQVILYRNGPLVYQYKLLTGVVNSATVGTESGAGSFGLQINFNSNYLTQGMAIRIGKFPQWMRIASANSGVLNPGQCQNINIEFRSTGFALGTYTGQLTVQSNDPDENPLYIPVTYTIGSISAPDSVTISYNTATHATTLRWTTVGAPYYNVYSSSSFSGPFTLLEGTTSATSLTITSPTTLRKFFVVKASDTP